MSIERFEQLDVWQRAHALVLAVYRITATFPSEERFGLVSQMRRAAVSVPANIVEGFRRHGQTDKSRFYNIAQGSLDEVRYYLILARDLGYTTDTDSLNAAADTVARMLHGLIHSIRERA